MAPATKLTADVQEVLIGQLASGSSIEVAIRAAGIGVDTFYRWMKDGRSSSNGKPNGPLYKAFYEEVERVLPLEDKPWRQVRRITGRKHTLDETFFTHIDTSEKAWILGFIATDGNISRNGRRINFLLAIKDREMLEQIRAALGSNAPITERLTQERIIDGRIVKSSWGCGFAQ